MNLFGYEIRRKSNNTASNLPASTLSYIGVVHIPFPGYPVKELRVPGQFKAVGGCAVRHELFHGLLAVRCLLCPVRLGDLAPHRPDNIGKPPGGQLRRLHRYGNRAPGNILIYQPSSPPLW